MTAHVSLRFCIKLFFSFLLALVCIPENSVLLTGPSTANAADRAPWGDDSQHAGDGGYREEEEGEFDDDDEDDEDDDDDDEEDDGEEGGDYDDED